VKAGTPAEKLANLPSYRDNPHFSERDQTALEFCERTTRDDLEVTDECLARVRKHFGEPELVELTLIAGFQIFPSRFAKAFLIAPQGFSAPSSRGCPRAPHGRSISTQSELRATAYFLIFVSIFAGHMDRALKPCARRTSRPTMRSFR
jgi:hypothetical protein